MNYYKALCAIHPRRPNGVALTRCCTLSLARCSTCSLPRAHAHGVAEGDKDYIQEISCTHLQPFTDLGAKHMVTGYDHLLFLAGVIFILYQLKGIALYVSLFAVGHSVTMVYSVCAGLNVNAYP
ncbi:MULTISPECIES: HupE/UreJ family protein [Thauera]|uniref:Uncharacterized protein n=1 Tax=Thauera chlorobenzoica TaxID=96773 RepID=A0A1L6F834_9RHOO|nr:MULTISPECIES: HupE/UreJ family protein [Thauera]APR03077.1 hypothetical protein Tchl_0204 [Thauera chlorobenzoica]HRK10935.1 HupE/UreJ family protein [Thauera sp.]